MGGKSVTTLNRRFIPGGEEVGAKSDSRPSSRKKGLFENEEKRNFQHERSDQNSLYANQNCRTVSLSTMVAWQITNQTRSCSTTGSRERHTLSLTEA